MPSYNKVILMGNLTRDPQLSYLPSQTAVAELGLAVNRRWKDKDGEKREETCFVDCKAFGQQAQTLTQYLQKGSPVMIEGRLQLDTWQDKQGNNRSKHRVVIERFQFLGAAEARNQAERDTGSGDKPASRQSAPTPAGEPPAGAPSPDGGIPF